MKKKTVLAALAVCAGLALTGCDTVNVMIGTFSIADTSESTTAEPDVSETAADAAEITTTADETAAADETTAAADETTTAEVTVGGPAAEGGNPSFAHYIEVTVLEDKYFYENHEISYEELLELLDGLDGDTAVVISDKNATLKAYESLTKALEERGILFETAG